MSKLRNCPRCGGSGKVGGSQLAELRAKTGLDQASVAKHLGIQRTGYSMIENGRANMTADKVFPLAEILKTTPQKILDAMYGDPTPNTLLERSTK